MKLRTSLSRLLSRHLMIELITDAHAAMTTQDRYMKPRCMPSKNIQREQKRYSYMHLLLLCLFELKRKATNPGSADHLQMQMTPFERPVPRMMRWIHYSCVLHRSPDSFFSHS